MEDKTGIKQLFHESGHFIMEDKNLKPLENKIGTDKNLIGRFDGRIDETVFFDETNRGPVELINLLYGGLSESLKVRCGNIELIPSPNGTQYKRIYKRIEPTPIQRKIEQAVTNDREYNGVKGAVVSTGFLHRFINGHQITEEERLAITLENMDRRNSNYQVFDESNRLPEEWMHLKDIYFSPARGVRR